MQAQRTLTLPSPEATKWPCGCAAAECGQGRCSLDALMRPRFFCGQLLTDQDLMSLVGWTRDKLRLGRFRHGWGVICGLDVRCDPDVASGILVTPGYAVSCCGDDIVVPSDYHFDLGPSCRREPDPCTDPYRPKQTQGSTGKAAEPLFRGGYLRDVAPEGEASELRVIDLAIGYQEEHTEPQIALAHGVCGQRGACDNSRSREGFKLAPRPVYGDRDPVTTAADEWERGYARCLDVLTEFAREFSSPEPGQAAAICGWLRRWLHKHPPYRLCLLRDRVDTLEQRFTVPSLIMLLFLVVLDCRDAYLTCTCHVCAVDHGVPLARVWLRSRPDQGGHCHVLAVDPFPPFRRPLGPTCWPARLGELNVGQVIGHRWDEACVRLADLGVQVAGTVAFTVPDTVAKLQRALDCRPFVTCGDAVRPQVVDLGELGRRVVGFCGEAATAGGEPEKREQRPRRRAAR